MKKNVILSLILCIMLIAVPVFASVTATIGGQNSSKEYDFTVTDGVLAGSSTSTAYLSQFVTVSTATIHTLTSADNGKVYLSNAGTVADFTLPDCDTDQMAISFVATDAYTITVDTYSTEDTIDYLTLDAGDAIDSAGAIGDSIDLSCYTDNAWVPIGMGSSAWTDGGAN